MSASLRDRVNAAARELSYAANAQAQAVARGHTSYIPLLLSDIADSYFGTLAAAVMRSVESRGFRLTIAVTERRIEREIELVREFRGQRVRAIVLAGSAYHDETATEPLVGELKLFEASGGTVVLVSRTNLPFDNIDLDNFDGSRRLAVALARLGYRSVHILAGEENLTATRDRVAGFTAGFADKGITVDEKDLSFSEFSWDGGYRAILLLEDDVLEKIDLVFAVNDEMALGAVAGLRGRGFRVPDDIAVAGFDDIRTLRNSQPSLTTVHVPVDEIGEEVANRIDNVAVRRDVIQATVVLRDSTPRRN